MGKNKSEKGNGIRIIYKVRTKKPRMVNYHWTITAAHADGNHVVGTIEEGHIRKEFR